jgi:hypothetical protein
VFLAVTGTKGVAEAVLPVAGLPVLAAAELALVAAVMLGTTLRAIGRGFGRGTLGLLAHASTASAEKPIASVKLVARAVDRKAAARTRRLTAFLRGESFDRSGTGLFD